MGFAEALTIVFIVLKLTGVIAWSWWAVLSPELISIGIGLFMLVGVIVAAVAGTSRKPIRRRR